VRTRTNRLRPNLDALEAREVCWAAVQFGALAPIVHLGPITPPAHQLHVADSVFTLANNTEHSLTFTVQWQGSSALESYTLMPGESRQNWVREVERFPAARTAVIRVDGMPGGRGEFRVTAALTADGPNGPVSSGPVYMFQPGPAGGVTLQPATGSVTAGIRV
jgi:hypothetical protein